MRVILRRTLGTLPLVLILAMAVAQSLVDPVEGSFLELAAQVMAPSTSPSVNSTNDISAGDQVRWTTYFNSRIDSPFEAEGELTLPANNTWVAGSVRKPANTSLQWQVSGNWTDKEPADGASVTAVKWLTTSKFKTATSAIDSSVNFSGTGDGYRIIPYKDGLYVVNHHAVWGAPLQCRSAKDGNTCPGWSANGFGFALETGQALPASSSLATPNNPMEALNYQTGELFVAVVKASDGKAYIACTNLDTRMSCGAWPIASALRSHEDLTNFDTIGDRYFVLSKGDQLVCFDIAKRALCGTTSYPGSFNGWGTSTALGSQLYFAGGAALNQLFCHDASTNQPCAGWTNQGVLASAGAGAYPYLNADGTPAGVCTSAGKCVSPSGQAFNASWEYSQFIGYYQLYWSNYHNLGAIRGSKIYSSTGKTVACFDFATKNLCGTWQHTGTALAAYATRFDPNRENCLMALGHEAQAMIFDVSTGGPCTTRTQAKATTLKFNPIQDYFSCDPSRARVEKWGYLRLSPSVPWGGSKGLNGVTVTLKDGNGQLLPAALRPIRSFADSTYQLYLGDIPYADYPNLTVDIELSTPGSQPIESTFGVDLTYVGDPIQVCVSTKVPAAPACQTVASVTLNSRAVDTLLGKFQESLSASKVMSPGGLSSGYAAFASPTTPRLNLTAYSPLDPRTQVVQGRWALQHFSGDLWAFNLNADGQILPSSLQSAQGITLSPTQRPMFTAPAFVSTPQPVRNLDWVQLTGDQQKALNLDANGVSDTKGISRLAYLRGVEGNFRGRSGSVLGPVINSAPVVLPVVPSAGLPDAAFPGYSEYRKTSARAYPLALYGGNDGALHAYEAKGDNLREAWSFVPDVMLRQAARFSDLDITGIRKRPYFVDNVPMVGHVNTGSRGWKALAVITYGRGARAITALDVTKSDLSQGAGVLFEYDNTTHSDLKDLGYIISQPMTSPAMNSPQLVQLKSGAQRRSAVLVGNGIDSNNGQGDSSANGTGKAVLYAFYFDPSSGPKWHRWAVDELFPGADKESGLTNHNGLSTPTPVDIDGDGVIDLAYAGDLQGNLWRFDLRDPNAVQVTRLFKTAANQPITQAPFVIMNPAASGCGDGRVGSSTRCWQVVFHTGAPISPLEGSSNVSPQAIYSVLDKGKGNTVAWEGLTGIAFETNQVIGGVEYRALKPTPLDYARDALGWRIDLQAFEHGVGAPRLQPSGLLMFSSIRPATPEQAINVCVGPRSWLNEVDPLVGVTRLIPFDTNGDGVIDSKDMVTTSGGGAALSPQSMAVSGAQFGSPTILSAASSQSQQMSLLLPSLGQDTGQVNSWSGGGNASQISSGGNSKALTHANSARLGRMSWREVY